MKLTILTLTSLLALVKPRSNSSGMITVGEALKQVLPRPTMFCQIDGELLAARAAELATELGNAGSLSPAQKAFFAALSDHQAAMAPCGPLEPPSPRPRLDIIAVAAALREKLNPEKTIAAVLGGRVSAPGWKPEDSLTPIMAAPTFPTPMSRALAAVSQDYLLAGLERLPRNSITSVKTNPAFVAAFMAGLNHEMSRELLWREYPTDQRGTSLVRLR